jgi:hypothetical protein
VSGGAVNRVVVALLDARRVRGFVYGFDCNAEDFFVFPSEGADRSYAQQVEVVHCKAIYFVKSLEGNRDYRENKTEIPAGSRVRGRRVIHIEFHDGERLVGTTESYNPRRPGFFMYPVDPRSNNQRIFVVNRHVKTVRTEGDATGECRPGESSARVLRSDAAHAPTGVLPATAPVPPPRAPAAPPPPPAAAAAPAATLVSGGTYDPGRKVEAVLAVLGGRALGEVADAMLVPPGILSFWVSEGRRALEAALSGDASEAEDERRILRARVAVLERLLEESRRPAPPSRRGAR